RERYDTRYGEQFPQQLSAANGEGLVRSRLRFTRVVKLYDRIAHLSGEDSYARFFADWDREWVALKAQTDGFIRHSVASLALATRVHRIAVPADYEELMQERREQFATACEEQFNALALFLARAVLRSERSEADIVRRLCDMGFDAHRIEVPNFPIDDL